LTTDSRSAGAGQAFVALKGERFDAHRFLDERLAAACAGWIVRAGCGLPPARPPCVLEVPDTLKALAAIAGEHRSRFALPVVGITGSNGKTTTKEMTRAILAVRGGAEGVCANSGNLNNEVGLPLSVLELSASTRYAVFEMGASRPGDIAYLCSAAKPTLGVLTNIGCAHMEFFGSAEAVFKTKSELADALLPGAPLALNADDPWLSKLIGRFGPQALTFGRDPKARVRILDARPGECALLYDGERVSVRWEVCGRTHRCNAAAAAAAALGLGFSAAEVREGLSAFRSAPLRFASKPHASGAWLLVDAYNANPDSMRAGVETFLESASGGRRLLVLGDMKELGAESAERHRELGLWLAPLSVAGVFLLGPECGALAEGLKQGAARFPVVHAPDAEALKSALRPQLGPGVSVFFKASRAMRLEEVAEGV